MLVNNIHSIELASSIQTIRARVELYNGSTLEKICNCGEVLADFTVDRTGEGKFFGYGICQKLQANLIDGDREINLTPNHTVEASFGVGSNFIYPFPKFYIKELSRDEDTNDLSITAYDILYIAAEHTVSELGLAAPYSVRGFVAACAALLGVPFNIQNVEDDSFDTVYTEGANFSGDETIRSALNSVAEITQTIYYINSNWELTFKRINREEEPVITIDKNDYFNLINNGAITLANISHVTELGDNVTSVSEIEGVTQYIRENPFWELRDDVPSLLYYAQEAVGGITMSQFECEWFGNYLLEIADKISLITQDGAELNAYVMDDTLSFNGAFEHIMKWHYDENSAENEGNPASLGEVINQTYARVDKANKRIELMVTDVAEQEFRTTQLELNADGISATVKTNKAEVDEKVNELTENYEALSKEVSLKLDAEGVRVAIENELNNGVDSVKTTTGFTFDKDGLTVSKTDSEISTQITEDGMTISKSGQGVLIANNQGVKAGDLHAVTYLKIGNTSRFEDWNGRTGCFWIGQ